jgi:tetratricopeptide (TPR) repeat protein
VDESGEFAAGVVVASERSKVPPETLAALVGYLRLRPRSGWAWALMGELTNAEGDVLTARKCFERAKNLKYSPKDHPGLMQARLDVLDEYLGEQQNRLVPSQAESAPPKGGWSALLARPQAIGVLGLGTLVILMIAGLQMRQWQKSRSK